jgi:RimJ/RimL family protein N-acetyltransferase
LSTPETELTTGFVLDGRGRIVSTREARAGRGPLFSIIRSATQSAWAVRDDVPDDLAEEIAILARAEPPARDLRVEPVHAAAYLSLTAGRRGFSGPAFTFSDELTPAASVLQVEDQGVLQRNFQGWQVGEIAAGRGPVLAVVEAGHAVSVCFCARRSDTAAAAGVETAEAFRGRGFGPRVTAAWAFAIRATGRIPLYSASWTNEPSRAVARKLGLTPYASFWNVSE